MERSKEAATVTQASGAGALDAVVWRRWREVQRVPGGLVLGTGVSRDSLTAAGGPAQQGARPSLEQRP